MTKQVRARYRRLLRDYERVWKDRIVDKHLEDNWLERINNLKSFNLVSICEGHSNLQLEQYRRFPHINLRLKEQYVPVFASQYLSIRKTISNEIDALIPLS